MADHLYKAYLSYSHSDEVWARWLHRALETYRVPRALVGARPDGCVVPDRLSPIFRDRDDLSSSANLDEGLKEALSQSESLILVCSPSAAASRWVNEEVRYFISLGRAERVFCVVVECDNNAGNGLESCFPPALLSTENATPVEPLAVDPRAFADGKDLAKLKLIAGLLGVRLDELRRREHKRKRRRQGFIVAGLLAAAILAGLAISARQAEQRERQSAEQMASFIVDLGEELKSEIGLEALGLISARAMSYLEDIDPGQLTAETGMKVGLALRQIGQVSEGQGRGDEAIAAYYRSRDLLGSLYQRYPDRLELLFELGQAEFYVSHYFFFSGRQAEALEPARRYAAVSQQLYDADPDNLRWKFERSYAVTGLLAMEVEGSGPFAPEILGKAEKSLSLALGIFEERPNDPEAIANYSSNLAWAADAQMLSCELGLALEKRRETLVMAEKALRTAPGDNLNRQDYAYANSGIAALNARMGNLAAARKHWRTSLETLEKLWREDPSNERFRKSLQERRLFLANVLLDNGFPAQALDLLDLVSVDGPELEGQALQQDRDSELFAAYLIARARAAYLRGDLAAVRSRLQRVLRLFEGGDFASPSVKARPLLIEAQYLWWRSFGSLPENAVTVDLASGTGLRSCDDALGNARIAVITGQSEVAIAELEYLKSKGYRGADAAAICDELEQCSP